MTDAQFDFDRDQLATDFRAMFEGRLPTDVIDGAVAHLGGAPQAAAASTVSPAKGNVMSLVIYIEGQCTIDGGMIFDGRVWGLSIPGGGALFGHVYTGDIDKLYAKTSSFTLVATPVYTAFYFMDDSGNTLGSFHAGSVSTVAGWGSGGGHWH